MTTYDTNILTMVDNQSEALFKAVQQSDTDSVKQLLYKLNQSERYNLLRIQKEECGSTAVHSVAARSSVDMMRCVLESVSKKRMYNLLMIQSREGNTPVHWLSLYRRTETMKLIMDVVPAERMYKLLMVTNFKGYTPLHRAACFGQLEIMKCIVDFIVKHGQSKLLMMHCKAGNTAVHLSVERGYIDIMRCILETIPKNAVYNLLKTQNKDGFTAIHSAELKGRTDTLEEMMNFVTSSLSSEEMLDLLMTRSDKAGHTVVHLVAFTDETRHMRYLMSPLQPEQRQTILDSRNVNELTPLEVAYQCGIDEMISCVQGYLEQEAGTLMDHDQQLISDAYNEKPVESLQHEIIRLQSNLREENIRRQAAEQQVIDLQQEMAQQACRNEDNERKLQQEVADLASQNMILEKSLDEEQRIINVRHQLSQTADCHEDGNSQIPEQLATSDDRSAVANDKLLKTGESLDVLTPGVEVVGKRETTTVSKDLGVILMKKNSELLGYELDNVWNKEDSSEADSDDEDDSALEEFLRSCAIEKEYKPIPQHLIQLIYGQCRELNLECVVVSQSTEDWKHLLVAVVNPENIDLKLDEVLEQNPDFKITVENIKDPPKLESDVGDGRLQVNQKIKNRGEESWHAREKTSRCELIVRSRPTNRDNRQVKFAFYAVVPAHLVMTKDQKNRASKPCSNLKDMIKEKQKSPAGRQPDDGERTIVRIDLETAVIAKIRLEVEQLSSRVWHSIQIHNEREPNYVDLKHPPLFCYRKWFYQVQQAHIANLAQSGDPCPAARCSVESHGVVCHHLFANDIALLPLEEKDAVYLQEILKARVLPEKRGKIFPIRPLTLQWLIEENAHTIKVKNLEGALQSPIPEYCTDHDEGAEQGCIQSGMHLTFMLNNNFDTLEKGDCGAIVYLVSREGVHRPIGMYIGKINIQSGQKGFDKPNYKAIVLPQAFKDLQEDYPHHISRLIPV